MIAAWQKKWYAQWGFVNMSLASDFNMYYNGTVVLTETGLPFRVTGVDGGRRDDLSTLVFFGEEIYNGRGERRSREISHSNVNFKLPNLGWRKVNGNPRWVCYKPYKTVKKGLHYVRVDGLREGEFSRQNIWNLFQGFEGRISDDWCLIDDRVMFKRAQVGVQTDENQFSLIEPARYLAPRLERLVPGSSIIIQA